MIGVSVVFLAGYAVLVLAEPSGGLNTLVQAVIWTSWAFFAVDYMVRFALAPRRVRWFFRHVLDLAVVVLPVLRPLRLLRLIALLTVVQRVAGTALRGRAMIYVAGSTILVVFLSALAMLDAERRAVGATIVGFGDALWWAFVTITTVGYGDLTPVTVTGRLVAAAMMVAGIALLGTVTAALASWFVQAIAVQDEERQTATRAHVRALADEIAALRAELRDRQMSA